MKLAHRKPSDVVFIFFFLTESSRVFWGTKLARCCMEFTCSRIPSTDLQMTNQIRQNDRLNEGTAVDATMRARGTLDQ